MSHKFIYNNVALEVDLEDADYFDKYEAAFNALGEEEKALKNIGSRGDLIRGYCKMFYNLFNSIYGDGTSERLFGGKMNMAKCDEAYSLFLDAAKRCEADARQRRNNFVSKYLPNRDQRRHPGKNTAGNHKPHVYRS